MEQGCDHPDGTLGCHSLRKRGEREATRRVDAARGDMTIRHAYYENRPLSVEYMFSVTRPASGV
eukprot:gnl/Chilomastix_caulleri/3067.p2 GENE.gnl/Chilomastix_caulleri/3067~~gnl/Chilomastix_caulleri/3067.p2  ORF type:complete len:64 (+),score=1.60 gnl/Chilomastix_caulleri/3067:82-273(+)